MQRLYVPLNSHEVMALLEMAEADSRRPQDQARLILRQALQQRGLLTDELHHIPTTRADSGEAVHADAN